MKTLVALVIAIHGLYTFVPPAQAAIETVFDRCPLAALRGGFLTTVSLGDRNGLNPR
jgi:hypothetical protein